MRDPSAFDIATREHYAVANLTTFMLAHPDSPYRVFGSDAGKSASADAELIATIVEELTNGAPLELARRQLAFLIESLRSRGLSADLLIEFTSRAAEEIGISAHPQLESTTRELLTLSYVETWQPAEGLVVPTEEVLDLISALTAANLDWARLLVMSARDLGATPDNVVEDLLRPAMYWIGREWSRGDISVEEEHLATATGSVLLVELLADSSVAPRTDRVALVAMVETNIHELGPQAVTDSLTRAGWEAALVPTGTTSEELAAEVAVKLPDLVCLSVALPHCVLDARRAIELIHQRLGDAAPLILVGGLAAVSYPEYLRRTLDAHVCDGGIPEFLELVNDLFPNRRAS